MLWSQKVNVPMQQDSGMLQYNLTVKLVLYTELHFICTAIQDCPLVAVRRTEDDNEHSQFIRRLRLGWGWRVIAQPMYGPLFENAEDLLQSCDLPWLQNRFMPCGFLIYMSHGCDSENNILACHITTTNVVSVYSKV